MTILKVYGEDLAAGELNTSAIAESGVCAAGSTQGALCVNAFAVSDVDVKNNIVVTIKHGDTENGAFTEVAKMTIAASQKFAVDTVMATVSLPHDVKDYVTASVASNVANSGHIRVTLGYMPR